MGRRPAYLLIIFLLLLTVTATYAQFPSLGKPETSSQTAAAQWPVDSLGRRTPRGTVLGFIRAVQQENYAEAALYMNLKGNERRKPADLAKALQRLLDQDGSIIPRSLISDDTTGLVTDKYGPDLDMVGTVKVAGESFSILLEKTTGPFGGPIWLVSSETVQRIPTLAEEVSGFSIDQALPTYLVENKWAGVPIGQWLVMVILMVVVYLLAGAIVKVIVSVLHRSWYKARDERIAGIIHAFVLPTRICLAVGLFVLVSQEIGMSIIVRQKLSGVTLVIALIAFLLLLWRLIDVIAQFTTRQLIQTGRSGGLSAVLFFRRGIKFLLIAFGIIAVLNILGWDVTTGLAALGIGGIALALGAQKTIENFVGSITIIADQPLRVGDFCKIGDTTGTVEQIGMRSTQFRTPNRTIVVVPNGQLAALQIENFAYRDRLLFNPTLQFRYETTPDQIRYLLVELRSILRNHPKVNPNPARVRFVGLGQNSLDVQIFAYIDTADFNEFLEIQENLILAIMDTVGGSGTGFAFPSQTLYMGKDNTMSEEKTREAEQKVRAWREKDEL